MSEADWFLDSKEETGGTNLVPQTHVFPWKWARMTVEPTSRDARSMMNTTSRLDGRAHDWFLEGTQS